jgi:hypothetical protein
MRLDAYADMQAQQEAKYDIGTEGHTTAYIPGYDPDTDPMYNFAGKAHYSEDCRVDSENYWAGKTGQLTPPPPSYHRVHGRLRLGRLMDVYACQAVMRQARHDWQVRWWRVVQSVTVGMGIGVEYNDIFLWPMYATVWWMVKAHYNRIYKRYYSAQKAILQSGEPVWMPYETKTLRQIKKNSFFTWP